LRANVAYFHPGNGLVQTDEVQYHRLILH
jgi:hypothetical protein